MKKLTISLAALLCAYTANSFAALPTGTSKCVSTASSCGGFTFGLTGLYWRPSINYQDYALTFPALDTSDSPIRVDGDFRRIRHDYDWGGKINLGYVFPCSGFDINLAYTHWDNRNHDHIDNFAAAFLSTSAPFFETGDIVVTFPPTSIGFESELVPPFTPVGFPLSFPTPVPAFDVAFGPEDITGISARSQFKNNTWDVDFGQSINVGCNFHLRWFGGLRYSRLRHNLEVTTDFEDQSTLDVGPILIVSPIPGSPLFSGEITTVIDVIANLRNIACHKSDFNGVGPQFGLEANYHSTCGLELVGSVSTALIVGEVKSTFSERIEATATLIPLVDETTIDLSAALGPVLAAPGTSVMAPIENFSFRYPNENRVVPNIDVKLGLGWSWQFCDCAHSKMTIEAGYMVSHYYRAIDRLSGVELFVPEVRAHHAMDVNFDGPYVAVQVNL